MKIKRYKKVNKTLRFYSTNFGFRKPWQVLIDGTFCVTALRYKVNIPEQIPKYLGGETKLITTQCIIMETEDLGGVCSGALSIVKQFALHKCGHKQRVSAAQCIIDMVNLDSRYVIATQDREIQEKIRAIIGVPLLYLHMVSPTLEAPSEATIKAAEKQTHQALQVPAHEKRRLDELNKDTPEEPPRIKKKRKGGPNPLSCKKKKTKQSDVVRKGTTQRKVKKRKTHLEKKLRKEVLPNS